MNLLIDDIRSSKGFDITARTAKAGKQLLLKLAGAIDELYIDHDLGCKENGYDIINWALQIGCIPDTIIIVSMNPVSTNNIASLLLANNYKYTDKVRKVLKLQPRTATIQRTISSGGSFSSAECPYCSKSTILEGIDTATMSVICTGCSKKYLLTK